MIRYVIQAIVTKLHETYPNSEIYYNPIREVSGNSFVINLLSQAQTGEIGEAELFQFDFDIYYIPKIMQTFQDGSVDSRILDGVTVSSNLFQLLRILTISGFYNEKTKKNTDQVEAVTYDRHTTVLGDVSHFYCSVEFRGHYQVINPEETIKQYLVKTTYIKN